MNQITLEKYRCRECDRLFCIDAAERSALDLDFGCPYGCDDNGRRIGKAQVEDTSTRGGGASMNRAIEKYIRFVIENGNEVMLATLSSDLAEANEETRQGSINRHEEVLAKLDNGQALSQEDLQLIRDANSIHLNDSDNLDGYHEQAVELDCWLDGMTELDKEGATQILEQWLDRDQHTPVQIYRALHTLGEEPTPNDVVDESVFDDEGRCLKCGSKVSFADVADTVVFVGDEIVKRHDGDIINRNCVRCTYPEQYPDLEHNDDEDFVRR
jgi:hypothetical protein